MRRWLRGASPMLVALCLYEASMAPSWGKRAAPPVASQACEEAISAMKSSALQRGEANRTVVESDGISCAQMRTYLSRIADSLHRHAIIRRTCSTNYKTNAGFRQMEDTARSAVESEGRTARDGYRTFCGGR